MGGIPGSLGQAAGPVGLQLYPSPNDLEDLLSDGSIVVVGATSTWRAVVARILPDGSAAFFKRMSPSPHEYWSYLTSVAVGPDGSILAGGLYYDVYTGYRTWLIKLGIDGSVIWSRAYSFGTYSPLITSLKFVNDTMIVAARFHTYYRAWLGAIDYGSGSLLWSYWVGSSTSDRLYRLNVDHEGYIVVMGRTEAGIGGTDALLMLVSLDGTILWSRARGSPNNDEGWDAAFTGDGVVVVGYAPLDPARYKNDTIVAKFAMDGGLEWYRVSGGLGGTGRTPCTWMIMGASMPMAATRLSPATPMQ